MKQPVWLAEAWRHLLVTERSGAASEPTIVGFYEAVGHGNVRRDEVPWCAAFLGACLERSGIPSTRSLLARSYLEWGQTDAEARLGAIAILSRGADPGAGHVGFLVGETKTSLLLLGGNQADSVSVAHFPKHRLLALRWPETVPPSEPASPALDVSQIARQAFEPCLAHVLEMEGGFTDDPHDPGGPTNRGITLEVFAKYTGRRVEPETRAALVRELRAIPADLVRDIYEKRYWRPSRAAEMPPPVALMHFDASVNHGLRGGAELIQQAVQVDVDGEIGPVTMGAIQKVDPTDLVSRYADARRARYRRLPHFWRFGRGWLNRVTKTHAAAKALLDADASQPMTKPSKGSSMTTNTKFWGGSMTIWGAVITALSTVVPVLGPAIGLDLTPDVVRQAGEQLVSVIQAIGGLIGTIMTIYGRARATTVLSATTTA